MGPSVTGLRSMAPAYPDGDASGFESLGLHQGK